MLQRPARGRSLGDGKSNVFVERSHLLQAAPGASGLGAGGALIRLQVLSIAFSVLSFLRSLFKRREVLHQQPMDKDIATADAAQEDALDTVVEEGNELRGERAIAGEQPAKGIVLEYGGTTIQKSEDWAGDQPSSQSGAQPEDRPEDRPSGQPDGQPEAQPSD